MIMDWSTVLFLMGLLVTYAIGRAVGKSAARDEATPVIRVTIEVNGDPIGGIVIAGARLSDHLEP